MQLSTRGVVALLALCGTASLSGGDSETIVVNQVVTAGLAAEWTSRCRETGKAPARPRCSRPISVCRCAFSALLLCSLQPSQPTASATASPSAIPLARTT
jgi:hypothetical protein